MRYSKLSFLLVSLVLVALLLGALAFWIYEPVSGKSPKQIAMALLDYRNITATNGVGSLGTELPSSLMLYHENWNNCHDSGPDFAEAGYSYDRLGMYFERYFDLKRDLPGGHTWTLTCTVRAFFPFFGQRWWTQQLTTINDGSSSLNGGQSNSLPSDAVISKSLPGIWHMTAFASANGWKEEVNIGTNGDYSTTNFSPGTIEGDKEFGRVQVVNGVLIMTATNRIPGAPPFPITLKFPYTALRQRIIQANGHEILISAAPLDEKMLLEKEKK